MKRIVASVGLVALGASSLEAASASDVATSPLWPLKVSATLRGFYDDNVNSVPGSGDIIVVDGQGNPHTFKHDSFGWEISPALELNWASEEQTKLTVGYAYSFRYFQNRPAGNDQNYDQTHNFNLNLEHHFTERYGIRLVDSFVIGQEPDMLRTGYTFETFQHIPGDNIRNYGQINFTAQLTPLLGLEAGYANSYSDYQNAGATLGTLNPDGTRPVVASLSGALDRMEHDIHLDAHWQWQPQTTLIAGYRFHQVNYIGDEVIGGQAVVTDPGPPPVADLVSGTVVQSADRDNRMHSIYVGADHTFRPDFTGSVRVGATYVDFYNDPSTSSEVSPYALMTLKYTYALESTLEAGFSYDRSATDQVGFSTTSSGKTTFTTDAQTAAVFATVNHRITPKLFGGATVQFQNGTYHGGSRDSENDQFFLAGLNLEYRFNVHFSAHVGYNYDKLFSQVRPEFDRNRVYMGITASY
jgi:hypothetical protein